MKLIAQTLDDAYQEWIKEEIKTTTRKFFELGKFFFGVSAGTIGFLTAILKYLDKEPADFYFISLLLLIISIGITIFIVLPRSIKIEEESDLQELLQGRIVRYRWLTGIWSIIWIGATVLGVIGIVK